MNWLILLALVAVFALQVRDRIEDEMRQDSRPRSVQPSASRPAPTVRPDERPPKPWSEIPGISQDLILDGWSLKRLFGYMWLHGNLTLGQHAFLWISATPCAAGNVKYRLVRPLGAADAQRVPRPSALGAVPSMAWGAYLVLFQNDHVRSPSGLFCPVQGRGQQRLMVLRLFWDVVGVVPAIRTWDIAHLGASPASITLL
jgi:hypothetical protein